MDQIRIRELQIFARHGVHPEETRLGQMFILNVWMEQSLSKAGKHDDLDASVSYSDAARKIQVWVTEENFQLIEAVAEKVADRLLAEWPSIRSVTVEVKKPSAPVGLVVEDVSVKLTRSWHRAFVGLGSNLGDKDGYLNLGLSVLREDPRIRVKKVSSFLTTEPWGVTDQDEFRNAAAEIETTLEPEELLDVLQKAEQDANRERLIHWGPRTLDLDLLFYDNEVFDTERLIVPHPEICGRAFVLEPMAEIAPGFHHPTNGKTMKDLLAQLQSAEGSK